MIILEEQISDSILNKLYINNNSILKNKQLNQPIVKRYEVNLHAVHEKKIKNRKRFEQKAKTFIYKIYGIRPGSFISTNMQFGLNIDKTENSINYK